MASRTINNNAENRKAPVFVVLQLSGGNDFMSTVIPYNDPNYFESPLVFRKIRHYILMADTPFTHQWVQ